MPSNALTLDEEQAIFDREVAEIKAWWASSDKQRQLKRYGPSADSLSFLL